MPIVIKKISRRAVFSVAVVFGVFLTFAARLFFGSGHINLSQLSSGEKNPLSMEKLSFIHSAKADVPSDGVPGSSGSDGGCDGCGGP